MLDFTDEQKMARKMLRQWTDIGEKVVMNLKLVVPKLTNIQTEYTVATLPGTSDEQIVVMTHTDGYFEAAMDNAAGMASALELARFYAAKPRRGRPDWPRAAQTVYAAKPLDPSSA